MKILGISRFHGRIAVVIVLPIIALCATLFYFANFQYGWQLEYAQDLSKVKEVVEREPAIIDSWPNGSTPLHYAAAQGRLEIVMYLVDRGADITAINKRGITAEQWARQNHFLETANYLKTASESKIRKTH